MKIKDFRDLEVWKLGVEIVMEVYRISEKFPRHELYGLTTQMRKASVSIPANIAEGFNRLHPREYAQFTGISLGSCAEVETMVEIGFRLLYLDDSERTSLLKKMVSESRMLTNLRKSINSAINR